MFHLSLLIQGDMFFLLESNIALIYIAIYMPSHFL